VTVVEPDHTDSGRFRRRFGDPFRTLEGVSEWFLDEDVQPRLEGRDGDWLVESVGRRYDDGVDRVVDDELVVRLVGLRAELLGEPVALLRNEVRAGNDVSAEFSDAPRVEISHPTEADDANPDSVANHVQTSEFVSAAMEGQ